MSEYTILVPAELPEHCFLLEALYWRAFGRPPLESMYENIPFRESTDNYEDHNVPNFEGEELSDEECSFAGLPPDPRMKGLLEDRSTLPLEHYEKYLGMAEEGGHLNAEFKDAYRGFYEDSKAYWKEVAEWMPSFEAYLDEFKAEICLDLRRGKLKAQGRLLPHPSPEESHDILEGSSLWYDSLPVMEIPQSSWITTDIDWTAGAIFGKSASYIWILIPVSELLDAYPPSILIKPERAFQTGGSVIVSGLRPIQSNHPSRRGRPAYSWDAFHVEIARLYAEGQMPAKKEAAIALLQEWFQRQTGNSVSRSAIGARLKPYFDAIGKK